jgi:hypothetical protein
METPAATAAEQQVDPLPHVGSCAYIVTQHIQHMMYITAKHSRIASICQCLTHLCLLPSQFWAKVGKLQQAQQLGFEGNRGPSIKADHYTIPAPVSLVEERQQRGRTKPHKPVELLMGSWPHEQWPEVFCCVYIVEWAIDVYLVGSPKQRKVDARRISMNAVQFAEVGAEGEPGLQAGVCCAGLCCVGGGAKKAGDRLLIG